MNSRVLMTTGAVLMATPWFLSAFQKGPLPGMTGGFGEPSCLVCHFDNPVNDPAGTLTVTGLPAVYAPGKEYALTVKLTRPQMIRSGFQLAARFGAGESKGLQAGDFKVAGDTIQIIPSADGKLQYVSHTQAGNSPTGAGDCDWKFTWIAPVAAHGPIVFDVAANAADGDATPVGDHIYTAELNSKAP